MNTNRIKTLLSLAAITATTILAGATSAHAEAPVKEIVASHAGWEVDKTTKANVCTVASGDECQSGKPSSKSGGFEGPNDVAVNDGPETSPHYHHVYVIDRTHRVQEFDEDGQFVGTFGWDVNETKDKEAGATQAEKNICTAASGDVCTTGTSGSQPGQFDNMVGVAVDPASGDVYIAEGVNAASGERVQKFTPDGEFVLEIGKEVNETTKGNLCTAEEAMKGIKCTASTVEGVAEEEVGTTEQDAFSFDKLVLAFGGPEDLLYVGEYGRVQELASDGKYKGEISLGFISAQFGSRVATLSVDATGNVYLVYRELYVHGTLQLQLGQKANTIYELSSSGNVVAELKVDAKEPGGTVEIMSIALDSAGRLATTEFESYRDSEGHELSAHRGRLYGAESRPLRVISEFTDPAGAIDSNEVGINSLAFNDEGKLYAVDLSLALAGYFAHELITYAPVPIAELLVKAVNCSTGAENETDAMVDCSLNGDVNPWGVSSTEAWFQYGPTQVLGFETPRQPICSTACGMTPVPIPAAVVKGFRPNENVFYQAAGEDVNVKNPELLTSETLSFKTPTVAPRIVGQPDATFLKAFSAVLSGEVNPENASTRFFFEYAPEAGAAGALESRCPNGVGLEVCEGVASTAPQASSEYGPVGATLEARSLQPATTYRYRLMAVNSAGEIAANETGGRPLPEGTFTTAPAPAPAALTLPASAIGTTSATVSGTVNPGGQSATYEFEVGVDNGGATQYGVVFAGAAGQGAGPIEETLPLSSLQPGTTYAYRIAVSSSYGTSYGETMTFTTTGLPAVLVEPTVLPQVPVPAIAFPTETPRSTATKTKSIPKKCAKGKKLEHGKCVRSKRRKQAKKAKKSSTSKER
jgi:hypothetical protein